MARPGVLMTPPVWPSLFSLFVRGILDDCPLPCDMRHCRLVIAGLLHLTAVPPTNVIRGAQAKRKNQKMNAASLVRTGDRSIHSKVGTN